MTVFYTGYRFVLRGQKESNWVNTYTGKVGVYSNWSLMSNQHLLDGAPNTHHVPGTGRHPGDVFMSRRFLGLDTKSPMDGSGLGPRLYYGPLPRYPEISISPDDELNFQDGARYRPWEYKGLVRVFDETDSMDPVDDSIHMDQRKIFSKWGHTAFRTLYYSHFVNWFFHGLDADQAMKNPGHAVRSPQIGLSQDINSTQGKPAATFGFFSPWTFKGIVSAKQVNNPGQAATSGIYPNAYLDRDHLLGHNRVNEWIGVPASNALGTGAGRHHRGNH